MKLNIPIAIVAPRRTPFAQIGKALGSYAGHELGMIVARDILQRTKLPLDQIDGVIVGEAFSSAPNAARVISNLIGLPEKIPAITLANNCVSGMEAVVEAARRIAIGEGELFLVLGEESQTSMPMVIKNARLDKKTATLDKLKPLLPDNLPEGVELRDTLEDGLGDSETGYGMSVTAELLSQNYGLSRAINDKVAFESFKRAYDATNAGLYDDYLIPVKSEDGDLKADEAVLLRKGLVENPSRMGRAMLLFDNPEMKFDSFKEKYSKDLKKTGEPTVSIFNASPRSDGAAGIIVTTPEKAKALGLEVVAILKGWRMEGVHPNLMGLGQAEATMGLLQDVQKNIQDIDTIEIHEAFAATAIGALEEIKKRTGFEWEAAFDNKKINPNGGSIAVGHPFGATGLRLVANGAMDIKAGAKDVLLTACAHGGVAGALYLEKP